MSRSKGIKLPPVNRDVITETFEGGETMENDHLVEVAAPVEPKFQGIVASRGKVFPLPTED